MGREFIEVTGTVRDIYDIDFNRPTTLYVRIMSFIIYFIVFAITVPYFLFKHKKYDFLEAYLPNLDLVANLLSFHGGLFPGNFFVDLYPPTALTIPGFLSQSAVNYMALLGVTYIISRETHKTKSIAKGWSIGFIMLFMTYLLPSQFISIAMSYVYKQLNHITDRYYNKHDDILERFIKYVPSLIVGLILTIGVIMAEKVLIKTLRKKLINMADFMCKIPTLVR